MRHRRARAFSCRRTLADEVEPRAAVGELRTGDGDAFAALNAMVLVAEGDRALPVLKPDRARGLEARGGQAQSPSRRCGVKWDIRGLRGRSSRLGGEAVIEASSIFGCNIRSLQTATAHVPRHCRATTKRFHHSSLDNSRCCSLAETRASCLIQTRVRPTDFCRQQLPDGSKS